MARLRSNNRRLRTKLKVFKDNLLKPKRISSIVITIAISILIILGISYLALNFSYLNKLKYKIADIGEETGQAVIILNATEVEDSETSAIIQSIEALYVDRKISKINLYILNSTEGSEEIKNTINSKVTKFDQSILNYNFLYNDVRDVCKNVKQDGASKGILFTSGDKIIRSLYLCNFFNLYYTGFKQQGSEEISNVTFVTFPQFISDFVEILFRPPANEG